MAKIHCWQRRLNDYATVVGSETLAELRRLAKRLDGLRVLHLSAGPSGSAVAETLATLVPLQRDLGLAADWQVLPGDSPRLGTTLYQGLIGESVRWRRKASLAWAAYAERQAKSIAPGYDVIVAHDPQAIGLARALPGATRKPLWVWHCHVDPRLAQPDVWAELQGALEPFSAALFPAPDLIRRDCPISCLGVAQPALDPCSPKNLPLSPTFVARLLQRLGLDPRRPVVGQFAPIDQRFAPIAALGTYWLARQEIPGLQIVLVDLSLQPSERTRHDLERVRAAAADDPNVHVLTRQSGLGPVEINALQRGVAIALQLAVPGGFGWGVAECQWKGRPAIVGRYGLLPQQVEEGASGVVVEGAPDAATALVRLLTDPPLAREIGQRGRELVTRQHLITRLTGDYLRLFRRILTDGDDHRQPRLVDAFPDPSVGAAWALPRGMMGQ